MTILLEIALVAAIVFGAVAYALGRLGGMQPAPPESGAVGLPPGPVTSDAIERTRFGLAFRGYRMAEVDAVLDRLRDELARRDADTGRPHGTVAEDTIDAVTTAGDAAAGDVPGQDVPGQDAPGQESAGRKPAEREPVDTDGVESGATPISSADESGPVDLSKMSPPAGFLSTARPDHADGTVGL